MDTSPTLERPFWPVLVAISALTGSLCVWFARIRTIWRDEAFTSMSSKLGLHDFWHFVLTKKDAVSAIYYVSLRPFISIAGHSPLALRMPSAIFMALTCAGVMMISHDLIGRRASIFTGLTFAILPIIAGFGSEARSYALSAAVATWSTWLASKLLYDKDHFRRWATLYWLSLVVTEYVFLYATAIIFVHLLVAASDEALRRRVKELLFVQGAAVITAIPLVVISWGQRRDTAWIPNGFRAMVTNGIGVLVTPFWSGLPASPFPEILAILVWGTVIYGLFRMFKSSDLDSRAIVALRLGALWAVVPGALYSMASLIGPYFTLRYIVFCAPAVALLAGVVLSRFRHSTSILWLAAVVLLVAFADGPLFSRAGEDGWGGTLQVLRSHGAPGEFVMTSPQLKDQGYSFDARTTGLPYQMTLIARSGSFPWTTGRPIRHWASTSPPPTTVIWLVSLPGAVSCSDITTLTRWGFVERAAFDVTSNPVFQFVSSSTPTPGLSKILCVGSL